MSAPEESQIPPEFAPEKLEKYPVAKCALESLGGDYPKLEEFTVGAKFRLSCQGEHLPFATGAAPRILFADQKDEFSLHVLRVLKDENMALDLEVTGYKPGEHKLPVLLIGDGQQFLRVEGLQYNIQTVIEAKQGEKVEPFPIYGPFTMSFPLWFWGLLLWLAILLVAVVYFFIRRAAKRRRLMESLEKFESASTPYHAFNKDLRQLLRKYEGSRDVELAQPYLKDLDEALRLYLIRQFKVPAFDWNSSQILREVKRRYPKILKRSGRNLKSLLREMDRAKSMSAGLKVQDCDQIREMSRRFADEIHSQEKHS